MAVLIDGYNLLHAARMSRHGRDDVGRAGLARLLGDWSDRTGEAVTVIFDGASPPSDLAGQLGDPRIRVVYSGPGVTADAKIEECLAADCGARHVLVVSSDHEVQASGRRRRAAVIKSEEFFERVRQVVKQPFAQASGLEPEEKRRGLEADGARRWIEEFGLDPGDGPFEHP